MIYAGNYIGHPLGVITPAYRIGVNFRVLFLENLRSTVRRTIWYSADRALAGLL